MKPFELNHTKRAVYILMVVICIAILSSCSDKNKKLDNKNNEQDTSIETTSPTEENKVNKENKEEIYIDTESENAGVLIFLGGGLTKNEVAQKRQKIVDEYFVINKKLLEDRQYELLLYDCSGQEFYCIIPRYIDSTIIVKKVELSDEGELEEKELIVTSDKPILIQCNESDLYPNTNITINHKEESTSFSPFISLKDGSVIADDNIEVIDLTQE